VINDAVFFPSRLTPLPSHPPLVYIFRFAWSFSLNLSRPRIQNSFWQEGFGNRVLVSSLVKVSLRYVIAYTESCPRNAISFYLLFSLGPWSATAHTGPGAHPASYTMGTVSVPGVKRTGRVLDLLPLSSAEVKERVLPLWVFMACSRVSFTFTLHYSTLKHFTLLYFTLLYLGQVAVD